MLAVCSKKLYLPHRPKKTIADDLDWWSNMLQTGGISRPIYQSATFAKPQAFSDASSGFEIGIIVGAHWHAW